MTAEIQDRTTGQWMPYVPGDGNANGGGNIRIDGQVYSNSQGMAAYQQQATKAANTPAPNLDPSKTNPIPTNPDGSQVGAGIPWEGDHPSYNPPGYHWDSKLAMFQKDPAAATTGDNSGGGGAPNYGFNSGQGDLLTPWTQEFQGRDPVATPAPPTFGPAPTLGAPSSGNFSYDAFKAPGDGTFSYGDYQAPDKFSYGDYQAPDKFSYDAFNAPDKFVAPDDVTMQNDPGWKFRQKTGQQEFLNSAAAKGLSRSGGTMKDFINYNQEAASQEYGQVYNRSLGEWNTDYAAKLGTYNTNRANAADIYNTNTNVGLTAYNTNRGNAADTWDKNTNLGLTAYNTNRGNAFQNYTTNFGNALGAYNVNRANAADTWNTNWGAQKDVYNAGMQGWQGTNALNEDIWKTQYQGAQTANQVNWNQDWSKYLQQYDSFKRNEEWPYQVLNQQSQPVG